MEAVIAKSLKVKYIYDDKEYSVNYPIESQDDQDILNEAVYTIVNFDINNLTVQLSKPFAIEKSKIYNKDQVREDLTQRISSIIGKNKSLNLTKK